jgi:hypothetical protein
MEQLQPGGTAHSAAQQAQQAQRSPTPAATHLLVKKETAHQQLLHSPQLVGNWPSHVQYTANIKHYNSHGYFGVVPAGAVQEEAQPAQGQPPSHASQPSVVQQQQRPSPESSPAAQASSLFDPAGPGLRCPVVTCPRHQRAFPRKSQLNEVRGLWGNSSLV